jgi:hypothetical protein
LVGIGRTTKESDVSKSNYPRERLHRRIENSIKDEIRIDLLRLLSERPATPRDLAGILGEDPGLVLGHLVELWADNCIEVVAEDESTEDELDRRYRAFSPYFIDDWEAQELSLADREQSSATVLHGIVTEILGAQRTGSIDSRTDAHLSFKPLKLDERGWRELVALLHRTLKEAEAIEESCKDRLGISDETGLEAMVALLGFERSKSPAA